MVSRTMGQNYSATRGVQYQRGPLEARLGVESDNAD